LPFGNHYGGQPPTAPRLPTAVNKRRGLGTLRNQFDRIAPKRRCEVETEIKRRFPSLDRDDTEPRCKMSPSSSNQGSFDAGRCRSVICCEYDPVSVWAWTVARETPAIIPELFGDRITDGFAGSPPPRMERGRTGIVRSPVNSIHADRRSGHKHALRFHATGQPASLVTRQRPATLRVAVAGREGKRPPCPDRGSPANPNDVIN